MHKILFRVHKFEVGFESTTLLIAVISAFFILLAIFFMGEFMGEFIGESFDESTGFDESVSNTIELENRIKSIEESQKEIESDIQQMMEIIDFLFGPVEGEEIKPSSNLRSLSGLTARDVNLLLEGTGIEGQGVAVIKAERLNNVNAWALLGISYLESGKWKSKMAREKHNYFGWGAYEGNVHKAACFNDFEECVMTVADYISREYLSPEGKHYNGAHLEGVSVKYASDPEWVYKVERNIRYLKSNLNM